MARRAADNQIDWQAIERQYRLGTKSNVQLGLEFNVDHSSIGRRAKAKGWVVSAGSPMSTEPSRVVVLNSLTAMDRPGFLYVIGMPAVDEVIYKIGMAASVDARLQQLQTSSPWDLEIKIAYFTSDMRREERLLHGRFDEQRMRGEWFKLTRPDLQWIAARSLLL